jgi:hypothetical protein
MIFHTVLNIVIVALILKLIHILKIIQIIVHLYGFKKMENEFRIQLETKIEKLLFDNMMENIEYLQNII